MAQQVSRSGVFDHCHAMAVDSSEINHNGVLPLFAGLLHVSSLEITDICQLFISSIVGGTLEHSLNH